MQVGYTENYKNIYTSKFGDQSKVITNERERVEQRAINTLESVDKHLNSIFRKKEIHPFTVKDLERPFQKTLDFTPQRIVRPPYINRSEIMKNIPLAEIIDKQAEDMAKQEMIAKSKHTVLRHNSVNFIINRLFSNEILFPCTVSPDALNASGTPIIPAKLANEMIAEKRQREANTFNFAKAIEDQLLELGASEESESSEPQIQAETQKQEEPVHAPAPAAAPAATPKAIGKVAFRFLEQNAPAQEAPKPTPKAVGKIAVKFPQIGEAPKSPTTQVRGRSNTVAGSNPSATPANSENMQALRKMVSGINLAAMMPGARPIIKKEEATTTSTTATTTNEAAPTNNENNSNAANGVIKHLTKDRVTGTGPKRRPPTKTRNIAT